MLLHVFDVRFVDPLLKRSEYPVHFTSTSVRLFRLRLRMIFPTSQSVSSDLSTACNSAWYKLPFISLSKISTNLYIGMPCIWKRLFILNTPYLIGPLFVVCTCKRSSLMRYLNQLSNFESKESLSFRFFLFNIHKFRFQIHVGPQVCLVCLVHILRSNIAEWSMRSGIVGFLLVVGFGRQTLFPCPFMYMGKRPCGEVRNICPHLDTLFSISLKLFGFSLTRSSTKPARLLGRNWKLSIKRNDPNEKEIYFSILFGITVMRLFLKRPIPFMRRWLSNPRRLWKNTGMNVGCWKFKLQSEQAAPLNFPDTWQWSRTLPEVLLKTSPQIVQLVAFWKFISSSWVIFRGSILSRISLMYSSSWNKFSRRCLAASGPRYITGGFVYLGSELTTWYPYPHAS